MDAGVSPAGFPAIQIGLGLFEAFETLALQRGLLGVSDTGFDFAFAIGIRYTARQGDPAVVLQHVPEQWIQPGVVVLRVGDAFAQVVENDQAGCAAQPPERGFVQFSPDSGTGLEAQQPDGFPAEAQRQDEQSRSSVLARLRVPDHRAGPIIDLGFFARRGLDDPDRLGRAGSPKLADEALHRLVAVRKAVIGDQVLPDGHGIAAPAQRQLDQFPVRLTGAGPRRVASSDGGAFRLRVGGRFFGRFCPDGLGNPF